MAFPPPSEIERILIPEERLEARVRELAAEIEADYAGTAPAFVSVLQGAVFFLTDLVRQLSLPLTLDFMAISSYGPGLGQDPAEARFAPRRDDPRQTRGAVQIVKDLDHDIHGRQVIVVEDIIDTGLTLAYLLRHLEAMKPAGIAVCTLLDRPAVRLAQIPLRYVGFEIGREFVVGYGLDYRQRYRNLPYIAVLKDEVFRRGADTGDGGGGWQGT